MASLLLRWEDERGGAQERELTPGATLTIGRSSENDLVLSSAQVSRAHARIVVTEAGARLEDLGSRNGTLVNDEKAQVAELGPGDRISIGGVVLTVARVGAGAETERNISAETVFLEQSHDEMAELTEVLAVAGAGGQARGASAPVAAPPPQQGTVVVPRPPLPPPQPVQRGIVPEEWLKSPVISERALQENGVEVQVVEAAALGGGLGSFIFIDLLRCSGMAKSDLATVGTELKPHARYERLCVNSQIPPHERLRSNSDSTPDNVWGFPGYAAREAMKSLSRGNILNAANVYWQIFGEPAIAQTYTPRTDQVFSSIDHEAERIGWREMLRLGRIRAIRKTEEGRLCAIVSASDERQRRHFAVSARVLHLAIGYPAIQLLPDLAEYRETYGDRKLVVNAYEEHTHIYENLRRKGGVVLIRGRGIVASRVIQKLWEERKHNDKIQVIHLNRTRTGEGHRFGIARRRVVDGWEFQPFNWPKACWSGEYREVLANATPEERKALLDAWGGTTTASRRDWRKIVREGLEKGWYRPEYGAVHEVKPLPNGRIATAITSSLAGGGDLTLEADYVIDCTGLIAQPKRSPLLADLIATYGLPLNSVGRLPINNNFEIEQLRHGDARLYAAGAMTLGGPMAAVDSFLGLAYAALLANDSILELRLRGHRKLNGLYSFGQWWKWARGVKI